MKYEPDGVDPKGEGSEDHEKPNVALVDQVAEPKIGIPGKRHIDMFSALMANHTPISTESLSKKGEPRSGEVREADRIGRNGYSITGFARAHGNVAVFSGAYVPTHYPLDRAATKGSKGPRRDTENTEPRGENPTDEYGAKILKSLERG